MRYVDWNELCVLPDGTTFAFRPKEIARIKGILLGIQLRKKTVFNVVEERVDEGLLRSRQPSQSPNAHDTTMSLQEYGRYSLLPSERALLESKK